MVGIECDQTAVTETRVFFWHRDNGGGLEARRDDSGVQRDIEDIHEDISQLVCTFSEQMARYVSIGGHLVGVIQCLKTR